MGILDRKNPEQVFTPRGEFNPSMYAPRRDLEEDFVNKLRRQENILVFGESGCGKTWLFKRVFAQQNIFYKVVNLAHASRSRSISNELLRIANPAGTAIRTGYDQKKGAGAAIPGVANATLDHTDKYNITTEDPLISAIKKIRNDAKNRKAFIVFDNLERIFDKPELMEELADIITLADDSEFISNNVRLLIVGVPAGVKDYFSKTPNHRTIANRIIELKEVTRLSEYEASRVIKHGFETELGYKIDEKNSAAITQHILWVTDRIPQALQDYCLTLALHAEKNGFKVHPNDLQIADRTWLTGTLNAAYQTIESQLNERDTKVQRRNQVLYVLGKISESEFRTNDVENAIRTHLYEGKHDVTIGGVANCLAELADGNSAGGAKQILRRTTRGDAYMFIDPLYRMCIRAMLRVSNEGKVEKIGLESIE